MSDTRREHKMMRRLARAWRRHRRFVATRGVFHLVLWVTALAAVDFAIDWRADLAGRWRLALLGANLLVLLAVAYWTWWRKLHPYDPVRVALQVERRYPQLGSLLVSYVQFQDQATARSGASPSLVNAMLRQAEERAGSLHFGKIVRFRSLGRLSLYVLAACGLVAAAAYLQPEFARAFAARMLNPNSPRRYPTRTILADTTGDLVVQYGNAVVLRAVVSGEIPEEGLVRFEPEDGEADTIRVPAGESRDAGRRDFTYRVDEAYRSFVYSFRVGDAVSPVYRVLVVPAPRTELQATVTYPEYMGQEPIRLQMMSFEAPAGSRVDWSVTADRALADARMIREPGEPVPVSLATNGCAGAVSLTPTNSFSYGFRWTDGKYGFVYAPEVRYSVRVVPDRPPWVALTAPVVEDMATVWKAVDIAFTAKDDYGLASARLAYSVFHGANDTAGDPEKKEEILVFPPGRLESTDRLEWHVLKSIPGLKPGDTVRYAVEVLDRRPAPGGPGVARSETCRLTIVSQEEYVRLAMDRRRQLLSRIKGMHGEEREAAESVQSLLKKPESGTETDPEKKSE